MFTDVRHAVAISVDKTRIHYQHTSVCSNQLCMLEPSQIVRSIMKIFQNFRPGTTAILVLHLVFNFLLS